MDRIGGLPIGTLILLIVNVSIHGLIFITSFPQGLFAISADYILHGQLYRLLSSAFVHGGILHIFMNMSSLISVGAMLELNFGTMSFLIMSVWGAFCGNIIYCILEAIFWAATQQYVFMRYAAVGYSGVLFAYAAIDSYHAPVSTRSVFGVFNVPSRVYPWVILVLISVVLPGISFTGHLSGIIYGVLLMAGLDAYLIPSTEGLERLDTSPYLSYITTHPSFCRTTGKTYSMRDAVLGVPSTTSFCSSLVSWVLYVFTFLANAIDTLLYIINCPSLQQMRDAIRNAFQRRTNDTHDHGSDTEADVAPSMTARIQRTFTSARDSDGRGTYAPVTSFEEEIVPVPVVPPKSDEQKKSFVI